MGCGSNWLDKVMGGGTGAGLSENVREAYSFLANNYTAGDSIYLIGFSRGAFTARSIAGLIGGMGLLTKEGLQYFYRVFEDVSLITPPYIADCANTVASIVAACWTRRLRALDQDRSAGVRD